SEDWDLPDLRRRGSRLDAEPDRGATVLTLGIISLACLTISCFPVGLLLGLIAWIMGQNDLRKMKRGDMDSNGEGMTRPAGSAASSASSSTDWSRSAVWAALVSACIRRTIVPPSRGPPRCRSNGRLRRLGTPRTIGSKSQRKRGLTPPLTAPMDH